MKDEEKLPKWAQYEIKKLERKIESLEEQVSANDDEDSLIAWNASMKKHGLPSHARVSFKLDNGEVSVNIYDGVIRVTGNMNSLLVRPRASNAIELTLED